MENDILVSISCATYNHESYIRQCLEGFVMQKTNFEFEILIHDDASTDGTTTIIREYVDKYPNLIKPIFQTENQYSKGVPISQTYNWPRARGKYIALCEGDDYWTDPYKLQKQVDFLEANPEYGMVYGKVRLFNQEKGEFGHRILGEEIKDYSDLIIKNKIQTLSVMFRKHLQQRYVDEVGVGKKWLMGDAPLWLFFVFESKIKFLDEIFGVYRFLQNSATGRDDFNKRERFIVSGYDMRMFFADKYNLSEEIRLKIREVTYRHLFANAKVFDDVNKMEEYFNLLETPTFEEKKFLFLYKHHLLVYFYNLYRKIRHSIAVLLFNLKK